ncbi:MAG: tetratricopeptide repeat protein, partial [Candidatus Thermoplasmatota archaeon]|nr:tetratricopeptide repeat protein [Candidatus Thermoplasmatota archaeon]
NILKNITPEGFLDIRTILEPKRYVDYTDRKPEFRYFIGREKELKEINNFMGSKSKILCIKGIAGIGKTALLSKFLEDVEMNVFWHRFSEFGTLRSLLTKASDFLSRTERRKLENYLKGERFEVEEILILLEQELKGSNSLLVFDDFQKASKEIVDFFRSFKDLETDVKTIVLGRTIPLFYDRQDVVLKKNISEMVLGGLSKESSVKLLRHRKIEKDLDRLYSLTRGHPLLLELVTPETKVEVEDYIKEEIIRRLKDEERNALELASVFRHPFPGRAVVNGTSYDIIDGLVDKSLMQRSGEIYDLHDVLRDFTYSRLSETKRNAYHKIVAEYYEKEGREGGIIEAMYHFLKAKEQTKAAVLAINNSKNLINNGFWKELSDILEMFAQEYVSREKWTKILRWKVECYMLLGKWDDALDYANKALELCKSVDDKNTELSSLCKIAEIYVPRGKYGQALSHLERALEISQKLGDLETTIETQYLMADAYRHTPNLDKALMVLNEAIKLCDKTQNQRWLVKIYAMIGNTYWSMGEYEKSAEFYRKGLGYAEILKDRAEIARLHNNIGVIYSEKGEFDNALLEYEKCIAICSQIGYSRQLGFGLSNAAFAYARKGGDRKAEEYVEKSLVIFKKLKEKGMIGHGLIVYGLIYKNKRLWRKAEENFVGAIKSGEEIGDIYTLSLASFELAKMYQSEGDIQKAKTQFQNALECYMKLGNKTKVEEVKKELEKL